MKTGGFACSIVAALITTLLCCGSGCYRVAYTTNLSPGDIVVKKKNNFGLYGLIGHAVLNADIECQGSISRAAVYHSALDIVLSIISLGFYTPSTTELVCAHSERRNSGTSPHRENPSDGESEDTEDGFSEATETYRQKSTPSKWRYYDRTLKKWVGPIDSDSVRLLFHQGKIATDTFISGEGSPKAMICVENEFSDLNTWHYWVNKRKKGPVSIKMLRILLSNLHLGASTRIQCGSSNKYRKISDIASVIGKGSEQ